jgi:hypothetical protein
MKNIVSTCFLTFLFSISTFAQGLGTAGSISGVVTDPNGAVVVGANVTLSNALTGYTRTATTGTDGGFHFNDVPFNSYRIGISAGGFTNAQQGVDVRNSVPISLKIPLAVGVASASVTVTSDAADILENVPSAHVDIDTTTLNKLPISSPGAGVAEAITMTAPGVVTDSNGFYHPLGDHAETSFSFDGQPVNDQQSKVFSTQLPVNALQSLEVTTGFPSAEYGEKTSLIVNATTRSGLGMTKAHGSFSGNYGSFGTLGGDGDVAFGTKKFGAFFAVTGTRSGRFLDTPELARIHDVGNNGSIFNRLDFQSSSKNVFHLNTFVARNSFQIPNTYDQPNQGQRQKVVSFNIAPGFQHTVSSHTLVSVNAWIRHDNVNYYPSPNIFNDTPVTVAQHRTLTSLGGKGDVSYLRGKHSLKIGAQFMQTRLGEQFNLGITDFGFNAVCLDANGNPAGPPTLIDPNNCAGAGLVANPDVQLGLIPIDLTRGGQQFRFNSHGTINEFAGYITDTINWGNLTIIPGVRVTRYSGLSKATSLQPRLGLSYRIRRSNTILRASYARTLETPHNENLLLSSSGGASGVFGGFGAQPLLAGRRNQFNVGIEQSIGRYIRIDADYFWKFTKNAAEFDVLLTTPITFPIMWQKDKLDGLGVTIGTTDIHGFRVNTTMGIHGRLRYFGPEVGGLLFNSPVDASVFRTDSDDKLYQTTNARYQWKKDGPWAGLTWRYDNGQVSAGGTLDEILGFSGDEQAMMGFFCGSNVATPTNRITSCNVPFGQWGATRVRVPSPGTFDDDHNPARVAPRNLFDVSFGTDNLFRRGEYKRVTLQFTVVNITNRVAMFNFLSTFGGTHFVQPRGYQGRVAYVF